jgi:hypothetical protein
MTASARAAPNAAAAFLDLASCSGPKVDSERAEAARLTMTANDHDNDTLPRELRRLTRGERKYAVPYYQKWIAIFNTDRPDMLPDNNRRVLNGAYGMAGGYWLARATAFAVPGGILASFYLLPSLVLLIPGGLLLLFTIFRLVQAFTFYPHLAMRRRRPTLRHPDIYE